MSDLNKKNKDIYLNRLGNLFETIFCINRDCPWTKSLNLKDLLDLLNKEIDEVSYALEKKDVSNLEEEIGDVLFNIFLIPFIIINSKVNISFSNSITFVIEKMIKRHTWVNFPHRKALETQSQYQGIEEHYNKANKTKNIEGMTCGNDNYFNGGVKGNNGANSAVNKMCNITKKTCQENGQC